MKRTLVLLICCMFVAGGCANGKKKTKHKEPKAGVNLFSLQQDKDLGIQVAAEIEGNPAEYPILDSAKNVKAYKYIYGIRDAILNSGTVKYKDEFAWRVRIVDNDEVLNAFCTPGGYIYFYTGIIKYLDNEAQLAGVMGHEMGHADLRHSTRQMTKVMGLQILAAAATGDSQALAQVTAALIGLSFSRAHESEADHMSVIYLSATKWPGHGGAGFFEKIQADGGASVPAFLSTHPSPKNRVANYYEWAKYHKSSEGDLGEMTYAEFKALF